MVFKITSTKRSRLSAGFTLVEFLISSAIGLIVVVVIANLMFYSGRSMAALANYADLDNVSRKALDQMTREIRQVNKLTAYSTNSVTFEDHDATSLTYTYQPAARRLIRVKGGVQTVLLAECDRMQFLIFQRNPIGGTYDQYSAATPATCKLVQVYWTCSRSIFGKRVNTESVQTAKVVIRKQRLT